MNRPTTTQDSQDLNPELAEVRRNLEQLSFAVSHDLRAPLRAIEGYAAILLEEHASGLDAEGQRLLGAVVANAHKLADQIAAILEYSRAGRMALQPVDIDMAGLFREVWDELKPAGRKVQFELAALPPAWGDRTAVRTVAGKLLDNALKFSAGRDTPLIRVGARPEAPGQCFEVTDNGARFESEYADKLFGLFQRLHGADEFPGLGTGLAIARLLLERQGGWIRGAGTPAGGACFGFGLPARAPPDETTP